MDLKKEMREHFLLEVEGQKVFGIIHRPVDSKSDKLPAVLLCHGLGGNKVGKHRLYVELAERLAHYGIIALRLDFRGSGDSEGLFSKMTVESEVKDALEALNFLKNDPTVDISRIGIFGRSFGGVVAVISASLFGSVKSLSLWAPLFSGEPWLDKWKMLKTKSLSLEESSSLMQVNDVRPSFNFFEQLFALNLTEHLEKLKNTPLLHVCGEKDQIVTLFHAEKFRARRNQAVGESKFLQYKESDHDFSHSKERYEALEETAQWFKRTLNEKDSNSDR